MSVCSKCGALYRKRAHCNPCREKRHADERAALGLAPITTRRDFGEALQDWWMLRVGA